jgi:hypothetical protein
MTDWYFASAGCRYGLETFGPYDTFEEAMREKIRVQLKAATLYSVQRFYTAPYNDSLNPSVEEKVDSALAYSADPM